MNTALTTRHVLPIGTIALALAIAASAPSAAAADEPPGGCEPQWDNTLGVPGLTTSSGSIASVHALIEYNGDLIAGGSFTRAGGQTVNRIARWDGEAWHPFVSPGGQIGLNGTVRALTVYNGDLIAGGSFTEAGGVTANRIARWDGTSWSALSSSIGGGGNIVFSLAVYDHGDGPMLYVGGGFNWASGITVSNIAKWDGETWLWMPGVSGPHARVLAMTVFDDGSGNGPALYAGGRFSQAGGVSASRIARWNGTSWSPLGDGVNHWVYALTVFDDDSGSGPALFVGGSFGTAGGGLTVNGIAKWHVEEVWPVWVGIWSSLGSGVSGGRVDALTVHNGGLVAGGIFDSAGGLTVNHIARWDGSTWQPFASGGQTGVGGGSNTSRRVNALAVYNGNLIAGGWFSTVGGQTAMSIAAWNDCPSEPDIPGDLNGDGVVDVFDLLILIGAWGECDDSDDCPADITGPDGEPDGVVDVFDLLELIANWG